MITELVSFIEFIEKHYMTTTPDFLKQKNWIDLSSDNSNKVDSKEIVMQYLKFKLNN